MKGSVKRSIWLLVAITLSMVVLSGIVTIVCFKNISYLNNKIQEETDINIIVLEAGKAHYRWIENLNNFINYGEEFTGILDYKKCALGVWIYDEGSSINRKPEIQKLINKIEPIHKKIHESAQIIMLEEDKNLNKAKDIYINETHINVETLIQNLEEVSEMTKGNIAIYESRLNNSIAFTLLFILFCIVLIIISCFNLINYVIKRVVKPVEIIMEASKKIAKGELDIDISIKENNEIGILAQSLNTSVHNINIYIKDISKKLIDIANGDLTILADMKYLGDFAEIELSINQILSKLNSTMLKLNNMSGYVSNIAENVSESAQVLAVGYEKQVNKIDDLRLYVNSITEKIQVNAESASYTNQQTHFVGEGIKECNNNINKMTEAMNEINLSSYKIEDIIKTIEDIAFQTNILALNAAVEAARAGVQGKSFAVVAEEVRNLAEKSRTASKNTTQLIKDSLVCIKKGTEIALETQNSIQSTVKSTQLVVENINKISHSSEEQALFAENISKGIQYISEIINNNSDSSIKGAAASEELSTQAHVLNDLLNKFKIKK